MSTKKQHGKKLITDKNTDYLFDYFMNEDKFNEQMRGQWDEEMEKKLENHRQPKLDSRIMTDKKTKKNNELNSPEEEELPSSAHASPAHNRPEVDFNDDVSENENYNSESSTQSSVKSPYGQKINAIQNTQQIHKSDHITKSDIKPKEVISDRPILGEKLVADVQKYIETPEERRARAREAYSKLQDLVEKYKVKLSREFTIDDDPDEMDAEYNMHKERRNKNNQVKFYKSILLNIVCGAEFLNERYNPFEFKLKDWSKQIASDMDDYTEVLEEIYEKYKEKGGKWAPEIKLLFMIIMSGVTFHLSQALFGSGGLNDTIQNNPNILGKLLGGFMKGGILGGNTNNEAEPPEAKEAPQANKNILAAIRKHNQNKQSDTKSEKNNNTTTTEGTTTDTSQIISANNEALAIERERRLLAEQRAAFENQMRKQNEIYMAQINDLRNQVINKPVIQTQGGNQIHEPTQMMPNNNYQTNSVNQILSDANRKPRFQENPLLLNNQYPKPTPINNNNNLPEISDQLDIFDSEIKDSTKPTTKITKHSSVKPKKVNYDELLDTLENSSDIDLDDIIETSNKRKKINSLTKPINSSRKTKNNSATRSATKRKGSDTISDVLSASRKNSNVIKL